MDKEDFYQTVAGLVGEDNMQDFFRDTIKNLTSVTNPTSVSTAEPKETNTFFETFFLNDCQTQLNVYDQGNSPICWAYAGCDIIRLTLARIVRDDFNSDAIIPGFFELLIQAFQLFYAETQESHLKGFSLKKLLTHLCQKYHLHFRELTKHEDILKTLKERPIVSAFWFTNKEWAKLRYVTDFHKQMFITKTVWDQISIDNQDDELVGHAVVIIGYLVDHRQVVYYVIKNSWCGSFAHHGFAIIEKSVFSTITCYDCYFLESDLTEKDKLAYSRWKEHFGNMSIMSYRLKTYTYEKFSNFKIKKHQELYDLTKNSSQPLENFFQDLIDSRIVEYKS